MRQHGRVAGHPKAWRVSSDERHERYFNRTRGSCQHPEVLTFPQTEMATHAARELHRTSPDYLVNHCLRSYWWAVAVGQAENVVFDAELLFVAAALHDLGLLEAFDRGNPFEVDGARAAGQFASSEGMPGDRVGVVQEAIALHVARNVLVGDGPEAYLLWHGTGVDVSGARADELDPFLVTEVLRQLPRRGFRQGFAAMFRHQAMTKPRSRASELVSQGLLRRLDNCVLDLREPAEGRR